MSIQTLTPPQDITWTRLAFTRDMIDTNFGDMIFSPKWRSSLAVYFYVVPEEETADAYPNSRIVYLKFTCSITGWNPSEDLLEAWTQAGGYDLDDLQTSVWKVILASGWADTYWPCLGAIMQIAIYPNSPDGVIPEDYPYIMDFEPKKRELFEQATEGSEVLSASSSKHSVMKGNTNTQDVEAHVSGGWGPIGGGVSGGASWQQVDQNTTDTSRENRETKSYTSSFSQMYQLFNGYHLGTNRALFAVLPRPHTVTSSNQIEGSLINGERKLEGLQDVFLVVHMPKGLDGFCIQASLDTGHVATYPSPFHLVVYRDNRVEPPSPIPDTNNPPPPPPPDPTNPPPPPPPNTPVKQLVITRRIVQSCGIFDENGNFHQVPIDRDLPPVVVGEIALPTQATEIAFRAATVDPRMARINFANHLNMIQSQINLRILDRASSVNYKPKKFEETGIFKSLVANSLRSSNISLTQLASKRYVNRKLVQSLAQHKITTLGDLFTNTLAGVDISDAHATRMEIIDKLLGGKKK